VNGDYRNMDFGVGLVVMIGFVWPMFRQGVGRDSHIRAFPGIISCVLPIWKYRPIVIPPSPSGGVVTESRVTGRHESRTRTSLF
jgi:hypothetical protein